MQSDSESSTTIDSMELLKSLHTEITLLKEQSGFLLHRLDSMQQCLQQDTFLLANHPIRIAPTSHAVHVQILLKALSLNESSLNIGTFLKALNKYLIHNELIDLNDLQIILNPLLSASFQKDNSLKKVPYSVLLNSLTVMFI